MKKSICFAAVLAVLLGLAMSAQASLTPTLAWDQSITPGVTGNKIYYGTSSGNYSVEVDLGLATTYTLPLALNPSTNWYFVVTAYNNEAENNESDPSNEIHFSTFDTDGDGLLDGDEFHIFGTSQFLADTDADGIDDGDELLTYGLDPLNSDSDGNGYTDGEDLAIWGSNWDEDFDNDGINNLHDPDDNNDGIPDLDLAVAPPYTVQPTDLPAELLIIIF